MPSTCSRRLPFPAIVPILALVALSGCSLFRPMPALVPVHEAASDEGPFLAGAAAVDITPVEDVWLGGYGFLRSSEGVHDPIFARALVLRRGALEVALVSVDVVGIQYEDIRRIQERMIGIDPRHVVISSTHNHSGPDTLGLWGLPPFLSGIDDDYFEVMTKGILAALEQARSSLRPAEAGHAGIHVEPQGLLRNIRRPGVVDREVVVLHLRDPASKATIATLVELGCHPEALSSKNRLITSDFPQWTRRRLEAELGGTAIYVSGALGALVSPDTRDGTEPEDEWLEAKRVGESLADHALRGIRGLAAYDAAPRLALWHLPVYIVNRNGYYDIARWTGLINRTRYRWGYIRTEVNLWELGGLRLATVPGELEPSLGLRLKRVAGGRPTMIVGLANDELGYLIPASEYDLPIYSYERTLCPGYDAADRLVRALEDLGLLADQRPDRPAPRH